MRPHRLIFRRMGDLNSRGEAIDRVTVVNELRRHSELESAGGLSAIVSLDDGIPQLPHLDRYVAILQEKSLLRRAIFAAEHLKNRCLMAQDGAGEILSDAEAMLNNLADGRQQHGQWLNPGQVMQNYPGGFNAFVNPPRGGTGIPTPWAKINSSTCGLHAGDLFIVGGRPSMGKSIIAMAIGHHAATLGHGAAIFSLEMTKESLVRRLISAIGSVDAQRLRAGCLDREERQCVAQAAAQIEDLPLYIDDTRARTIPTMTSALRKLKARHPVRLVVVDHLQLMCGMGRVESRHHELSAIAHSLKHLAGQFDVTVLLLSQLNRECEKSNRRPQLADLKESGSIEEDADIVMFVHRPEQFNREDRSLKGLAEFIIAKQRSGPVGKVKMLFQHSYQRFVETTDQMDTVE